MKNTELNIRYGRLDPNKICKNLCCQYGIINPPKVVPRPYSRVGKRAILGQYVCQYNEIQINKYVLLQWTRERLSGIISHELMHALCYQEIVNYNGNHGSEFKLICKKVGLPTDISLAVKK